MFTRLYFTDTYKDKKRKLQNRGKVAKTEGRQSNMGAVLTKQATGEEPVADVEQKALRALCKISNPHFS
jgi:hypothetical protein